MAKILIIGAGGVGSVVAHKCAQAAKETGVFEWITLASRTLSRCTDVARSVKARVGVDIDTAQVDADNVPELCQLIRQVNKKFYADDPLVPIVQSMCRAVVHINVVFA